jgi:hypothetical protein
MYVCLNIQKRLYKKISETNIECSLCRLIRRPEHLIGRQCGISRHTDHSFGDHLIECYRSFYCALFCVFMTRVSQCPISLRSEHLILALIRLFHTMKTEFKFKLLSAHFAGHGSRAV